MGKGECIKGLGLMGRSQQLGQEHWGRVHTPVLLLAVNSIRPVSRFCAWCCTKGKKAHPAHVLADKEPGSRSPRLPQHSGDKHHSVNLASQVHDRMHVSKCFFQFKKPPLSIAAFNDVLHHPVHPEIIASQPEIFGGEIY